MSLLPFCYHRYAVSSGDLGSLSAKAVAWELRQGVGYEASRLGFYRRRRHCDYTASLFEARPAGEAKCKRGVGGPLVDDIRGIFRSITLHLSRHLPRSYDTVLPAPVHPTPWCMVLHVIITFTSTLKNFFFACCPWGEVE